MVKGLLTIYMANFLFLMIISRSSKMESLMPLPFGSVISLIEATKLRHCGQAVKLSCHILLKF